MDDYTLLKSLGEGAYGQVFLAAERTPLEKSLDLRFTDAFIEEEVKDAQPTRKQLKAIKVVEKEHIERYDKMDAVMREKEILLRLRGHGQVVKLEQTF